MLTPRFKSRDGHKRAQSSPPKRVGIVAIPPVRLMDVIGPVEVFGEANHLVGPVMYYEIQVISATAENVIESHLHMPLTADATYLQSTSCFDTILVAGGEGARRHRHERDFLAWLKHQCGAARRYGSICTGALVLAEAGLLDGHQATTHWQWCDELTKRYPNVRLDREPVYVKSGRCYTSAGVTTGMDLSLALVEEDLGREIASNIARNMVLFFRRSGGQNQISVTLASQAKEVSAVRDLLPWIADAFHAPLSISCMADRAAMSPRNFARAFLRETGKTPHQHLEELRVEAARRLLEETSHNLDEIAGKCGFSSAEVLRRTFKRRLNVAPSTYRQQSAQVRKPR